jgi:TonB-dependent SusC/RagA subfamily outer membrane receptor
MSNYRMLRTLGCTLIAIAVSYCRPLTPREQLPAPHVSDPRARSASDASLTGGDDATQQSYASIEELIEGRAPGVQVLHRTDGTFSLRIRGTSSPASSNEPLILIDGAPAADQRGGRALAGINPRDVLKIEVLKDAASTAFYGMRGGNGVILITTRQE